jgi:hypothetical protein
MVVVFVVDLRLFWGTLFIGSRLVDAIGLKLGVFKFDYHSETSESTLNWMYTSCNFPHSALKLIWVL